MKKLYVGNHIECYKDLIIREGFMSIYVIT